MMKYLLMAVILMDVASAQDSARFYKDSEIDLQNNTASEKLFIINSDKKTSREKSRSERIENIDLRFNKSKEKEEYSFDLMSSVGSNISFGGFWENYAVINFTPNVYVQPVSFISIYADHNVNCLIPVNEIKEYSKIIALQSLSILAVDNSIKLLFPSAQWVPQIISFAAKNLLINFIIKPSIERSLNSVTPLLEYENYYYSVSITF